MSIKIICDVCGEIIKDDKDVYKERYKQRVLMLNADDFVMEIKTYRKGANELIDVCKDCLMKNVNNLKDKEIKDIIKDY